MVNPDELPRLEETGTVRVVYRKYDGSLHWHLRMRWLGQDRFGRWLGAPAHTAIRRGFAPPVNQAQPHILLVPYDVGWTAVFNAPPRRTAIYCDITTTPVWSDGEVSMIDLDLDVAKRTDGQVELLDRDEFDEHRIRYAYPPEVAATALATSEQLHRDITAGVEPFATIFTGWLARVT